MNFKMTISILFAAAIGSLVTMLGFNFTSGSKIVSAVSEEKPLYWVAPMDSNYRRDKPGKSPMGMDLVAVYSNAQMGDSPGTIKISPEVVNNLGVRVSKVSLGQLKTKISTVGYVMYDEDQLLHIHPRVEGWIEKLYVKAEGDPVKEGQALYDIYSPALVNAQEELLLALERNNERLIRAAKDRLSALQLPERAISELIESRKVKQNITFYAPQDGVLDNLSIREGFFVKPGSTLLSIAKLDQVWVEAEVFERQVSLVKIGLPVTMTLAYIPGKTWQGKVDYVYPSLDEQTRTIKVRLRFDNANRSLKPNMFAQVIIYGAERPTQVLVPREAVIRTGILDRVVLSLGEGRFKSIEVQVGGFDDLSAEILSGLKPGDDVVFSAQFLLDSESSNTSDFKRMNGVTTVLGNSNKSENLYESATVSGVINSINREAGMMNIRRGAIEKWNRPSADVDFLMSDNIEFDKLSSGLEVHFTFHIIDGNFVIQEIMSMTSMQSERE